ncbi:proline racemase [Bacterioplanes sanyensis]|uniref:proline racemase family protein n=1 Tax=Bacterioplanes sanyensis TaxID=1249553 RepID=UPI00167AC891|nr:proline racemase family protein [Bacterioplanes sanyensis]GGY35593.1 proline racemase [Bacterioplanes sanyensis]
MNDIATIKLIDTHAGGDVSRIVIGGVGALPGDSVRAQMQYLQHQADGLRQLLLYEPFGIPEMSVDLIVPACDPKARYGYIIMEVMGYPIYSGSNTICTATALLESGMIAIEEGEQQFYLESPAGLVNVVAHNQGGKVQSITIEGLPSYIDSLDNVIDVAGLGPVTYSIAYSGGFYALVDASALGFTLKRSEEVELAACAQRIVSAICDANNYAHPELGDVGPLPFLHFMGPLTESAPGYYESGSATYVHPGVICRSTTGTGTAARLAYHYQRGELKAGDQLETISLRNTRFVGSLKGEVKVGHFSGVASTITGKGYLLARSDILVDPSDTLISADQLPPLNSYRP